MIKLIAAISKNNQIGLNGDMPWHIPKDLQYFKQVTSSHTILMGRKTFESIGRPLPNRRNIVLTHNLNYTADGIEIIHSMDEALALCNYLDDIFIIGGGELYHTFLPYADELYLTLVDQIVEGDTSFPYFKDSFKCVHATPYYTQPSDNVRFSFTIWKRYANL
ncbi:MAG: dihydrofolate reductase [Cellulosilyticum sp.]|nr:dihydrofolate reductase [Cellulosilyticum sp.]